MDEELPEEGLETHFFRQPATLLTYLYPSLGESVESTFMPIALALVALAVRGAAVDRDTLGCDLL